jgi:hypothetical protein
VARQAAECNPTPSGGEVLHACRRTQLLHAASSFTLATCTLVHPMALSWKNNSPTHSLQWFQCTTNRPSSHRPCRSRDHHSSDRGVGGSSHGGRHARHGSRGVGCRHRQQPRAVAGDLAHVAPPHGAAADEAPGGGVEGGGAVGVGGAPACAAAELGAAAGPGGRGGGGLWSSARQRRATASDSSVDPLIIRRRSTRPLPQWDGAFWPALGGGRQLQPSRAPLKLGSLT